jgi:hypothetical protein
MDGESITTTVTATESITTKTTTPTSGSEEPSVDPLIEEPPVKPSVSLDDDSVTITTLSESEELLSVNSTIEEAAADPTAESLVPPDEDLKIYLSFDFVKFNASVAKKLFGVLNGHGKISVPNWGVRGADCNYVNRVIALREYFALSTDEQKRANKRYREEQTANAKKIHKNNFTSLNLNSSKNYAVSNHPRGLEIAISAHFNTNEEEEGKIL